MRKLAMLVAIVVLLTGGNALAQCNINPDADEICVVFDYPDPCCQNCIRDVIAQVTAYVVLQNPSAASGVSGFDFMLCNSGGGGFGPPPGCFLSTMTLPPGALNTSGHPQYTVGIATPLPQEPCVLLLTMNLLIFCSDCWCFGVQGIPFGLPPWYMTYFDANMLEYILSPCTGPTWDSCTMACINCEWCPPDPPIGTTSTTWGELKALYD